MSQPLRKLTLRGFKSIAALEDFELGKLNVLIGANGAGKSNFVDFFRMLRAMADSRLQAFIREKGGADGFFFLGPQVTREIFAHLEFGENIYEFELKPTAGSNIMIGAERVRFTGGDGSAPMTGIASGTVESVLKNRKDRRSLRGNWHGVEHYVFDSVSRWIVYHFHDTSMTAPMRREQSVRDRRQLRPDASNIAAFLLDLKQNKLGTYELVRDSVRLIAPFFDDFLLESEVAFDNGEEKVRLEWRQKGSDFPFQPIHLSDGTMRYICLATALLQPRPPATIVIDEPELGLHPFAISLLAELIHSAAETTQVIISTQSPTLLGHFEPEEIVVVNRQDGQTTFDRVDAERLATWLDEYTIAELWEKNVVAGGPVHE